MNVIMHDVRTSILATLAYHDILNYPMTAWEIFQFTLQTGKNDVKLPAVSYENILEILGTLKIAGAVGEKNGLYYLSGRGDLYDMRIERIKISEKKFRNVRSVLKFAQVLPFVRSLFLSGSVAFSNATEESDIDILVVARPGRIWTTRFFLSLYFLLQGKLRSGRISRRTAGKVCLNHYVTTASLRLEAQNLYNAATYVHLVALFRPEILERFYAENAWVFAYFPNAARKGGNLREFERGTTYIKTQHALELPLRGVVGDVFEWGLALLQKALIRGNTLTGGAKGRVVASDAELAFHPESPEKAIIDKFTKKLLYL